MLSDTMSAFPRRALSVWGLVFGRKFEEEPLAVVAISSVYFAFAQSITHTYYRQPLCRERRKGLIYSERRRKSLFNLKPFSGQLASFFSCPNHNSRNSCRETSKGLKGCGSNEVNAVFLPFRCLTGALPVKIWYFAGAICIQSFLGNKP